MPDPVRFSDLTEATSLADADWLAIETAAGVVKKLAGEVVLRAENNLADLADAVAALGELGGMPVTGGEFEGPIGFETGTVAAAGTDQASAAALTAQIVEVTTDAANKGVVLPAATDAVGPIWVRGHDSNAHVVRVYPADGDSINGGAADAYITLGAGTGSMLVAMSSTRWAEWV